MFVIFFGLVLLGVLHGLMFLPVVLSLIGPLGSITHGSDGELKKNKNSFNGTESLCETAGSSQDESLSSSEASARDLAESDEESEADTDREACPQRRFVQIQVVTRSKDLSSEKSEAGVPSAREGADTDITKSEVAIVPMELSHEGSAVLSKSQWNPFVDFAVVLTECSNQGNTVRERSEDASMTRQPSKEVASKRAFEEFTSNASSMIQHYC